MTTTIFEPDSSMDLEAFLGRETGAPVRRVNTVEELLEELGYPLQRRRGRRTRALGRAWAVRLATGRRSTGCRRLLRWLG